MAGLLYKETYKINENIIMKIPYLSDVVQNEDEYYTTVALIISTPYERMVELDALGIDFTTVNEWELFLLYFSHLRERDVSLIFQDLDLSQFRPIKGERENEVVLENPLTGVRITRGVHAQISLFLREILSLKKQDKKPANDAAKDFMLERAKKKAKRKKKSTKSQLENHITSLVNTSEFPYDYKSVLNLTVYQFYVSLNQVVKKIRYDKLMIGCYAGTVNMKELDQNELNWISN